MNIHWRSIPGFSAYEASSDGRIRRSKPDTLGRKTWVGHVLKPMVKRGYHQLWVTPDGGTRTYRTVQSLVALAFIGPRPHGYDIHHKDDNKLNNTAENLEYLSKYDHAAFRDYTKKLSADNVREILRLRKAGWLHKDLAKKFNVTTVTTINLCNGKTHRRIVSSFKHQKL